MMEGDLFWHTGGH